MWPTKGGEAAPGHVRRHPGRHLGCTASIGYADASQVGDLGVAAVKVGNGYVLPTR